MENGKTERGNPVVENRSGPGRDTETKSSETRTYSVPEWVGDISRDEAEALGKILEETKRTIGREFFFSPPAGTPFFHEDVGDDFRPVQSDFESDSEPSPEPDEPPFRLGTSADDAERGRET